MRVLIIEPDERVQGCIAEFIRWYGREHNIKKMKIVMVQDSDRAYHYLKGARFHLITTSYLVGGVLGPELITQAREMLRETMPPVLFISSHQPPARERWLPKPFSLNQLRTELDEIFTEPPKAA